MYAPLWNRLKANGHARAKVPPHNYYKVKRLVSKEKDEDTAYKLELSEAGKQPKRIIFSYDRKEWIMHFRLVDKRKACMVDKSLTTLEDIV